MKNSLKFLLCTLCCTLMFNTGYSMENSLKLGKDFSFAQQNDNKETDTEFLNRIENIIEDYAFSSNKIRIMSFSHYEDISIEDCNRIYELIKNNPELVREYQYIIMVLEYQNKIINKRGPVKLQEVISYYSDDNIKKMKLSDKGIKAVLICRNNKNAKSFLKKFYKQLLQDIDDEIAVGTTIYNHMYLYKPLSSYNISTEEWDRVCKLLNTNSKLISKYKYIAGLLEHEKGEKIREQKRNEETKNQVKMKENSMNELQRKYNDLSNKYLEQKQIIENMTQELNNTKQELNNMNQKYKELEDKRLSDQSKFKNIFLSENKELREQIRNLEEQLSKRNGEINKKDKQIKEYKKIIDELKSKNKNQDDVIKKLSEHINNIENNTLSKME